MKSRQCCMNIKLRAHVGARKQWNIALARINISHVFACQQLQLCSADLFTFRLPQFVNKIFTTSSARVNVTVADIHQQHVCQFVM